MKFLVARKVTSLPLEKVIAKEKTRGEEFAIPSDCEGAKVALEQTHQAMDTYFDFLKKSISAFPSSGTEIGDRWKTKPVERYCFSGTR